jgi:hypothetical protein
VERTNHSDGGWRKLSLQRRAWKDVEWTRVRLINASNRKLKKTHKLHRQKETYKGNREMEKNERMKQWKQNERMERKKERMTTIRNIKRHIWLKRQTLSFMKLYYRLPDLKHKIIKITALQTMHKI